MSAVDEIVRHSKDAPESLIVIVGPTASGKTGVALEVARKVGGEIVGADSVQVYRGFDIGSGKPTASELSGIVHHMLDVADPNDPAIDASWYASHADRVIEDIRARKKVPIVCGGTYFWVRSLLLGLVNAPKGNAVLRAKYKEIFDTDPHALFSSLRAVDPKSAGRLHPNDFHRVSRALEVYEQGGVPLSTLQEEHAFQQVRYQHQLFGIQRTQDELTELIDLRVGQWLSSGWIEEVDALRRGGFARSRPMEAVGYKQVGAFLDGALPREELQVTIVRATRIFARRQRTWLSNEPVRWLNAH